MSAQAVDERMINIHYCYYYYVSGIVASSGCVQKINMQSYLCNFKIIKISSQEAVFQDNCIQL